MKILISDDDFSARYALKKLLAGGNRTILEAADGQQTLDIIFESVPDIETAICHTVQFLTASSTGRQLNPLLAVP